MANSQDLIFIKEEKCNPKGKGQLGEEVIDLTLETDDLEVDITGHTTSSPCASEYSNITHIDETPSEREDNFTSRFIYLFSLNSFNNKETVITVTPFFYKYSIIPYMYRKM